MIIYPKLLISQENEQDALQLIKKMQYTQVQYSEVFYTQLQYSAG